MGGFSIEDLGWLRPAGADFRTELKQLGADGGPVCGADLAGFASFALDLNKLTQLDRRLTQLGARLKPDGALSPMRLAVLADATGDYIAPAIRASALRHGILADLYLPAYGQTAHDVRNPASALYDFRPDVALIAPDYRTLGLAQAQIDSAAAEVRVGAALADMHSVLDALGRAGVGSVIVQTLPIPPEPWLGHFDPRAAGSVAAQIGAFNAGLMDLADRHHAVVLDIAGLAATVGRAHWFDHGQWHRAKLPFALDFVPLYADHVARVLGAIRGRARKCLVLDLDNTCWGGVIGDDGLDGIRIGQGSPEGEAYLAVQHYALALKARGIVLAVCSKNDDATARLPFRHHPDMVLREDDFAVFTANWNDKATNLRQIAHMLNIGTDALAFLDDNPAERARVRQMLPEVAVPELPDDPAWYPAALAHAGYFESTGLSADDASRPAQYRANAARAAVLESLGDYDAYLESLAMECDLRPFEPSGLKRITQLVNKSNQFNLTTRRYGEADIARMQADPGLFTLQVRLSDRFGDNGLISVVIFRKGAQEWICDTWLMSCRVLGRRVEEAVLASVVRAARDDGAARLIGEYIPTPRNAMVATHFEKLGFTQLDRPAQGSLWQLALADHVAPALPMRLRGLPVNLAA